MSYTVSTSASPAAGPVHPDGELQSRVPVECACVLAGDALRRGKRAEQRGAPGERGGVPVGGERRAFIPGLRRAGQPEHEPVHARALAEQAASMRVEQESYAVSSVSGNICTVRWRSRMPCTLPLSSAGLARAGHDGGRPYSHRVLLSAVAKWVSM